VTDEEESIADAALSRNERLELLASKRRQELLAPSVEDSHSLESLATQVTQIEQGADLGARPAHRVCLYLHHVHLPKLDEADIVEYDAQRNIVSYTSDSRLERLVDAVGG